MVGTKQVDLDLIEIILLCFSGKIPWRQDMQYKASEMSLRSAENVVLLYDRT